MNLCVCSECIFDYAVIKHLSKCFHGYYYVHYGHRVNVEMMVCCDILENCVGTHSRSGLSIRSRAARATSHTLL